MHFGWHCPGRGPLNDRWVADLSVANHLITLHNTVRRGHNTALLPSRSAHSSPISRSGPLLSRVIILLYITHIKKGLPNISFLSHESTSNNWANQHDVFLGCNWRSHGFSTKHPSDIRPPKTTIPTDSWPDYPSYHIPVGRNDSDNRRIWVAHLVCARRTCSCKYLWIPSLIWRTSSRVIDIYSGILVRRSSLITFALSLMIILCSLL